MKINDNKYSKNNFWLDWMEPRNWELGFFAGIPASRHPGIPNERRVEMNGKATGGLRVFDRKEGRTVIKEANID